LALRRAGDGGADGVIPARQLIGGLRRRGDLLDERLRGRRRGAGHDNGGVLGGGGAGAEAEKGAKTYSGRKAAGAPVEHFILPWRSSLEMAPARILDDASVDKRRRFVDRGEQSRLWARGLGRRSGSRPAMLWDAKDGTFSGRARVRARRADPTNKGRCRGR